jgi:hypothetical protein
MAKKPKVQISARISELAKRLMELERQRTQESEGQFLERLILSTASSPKALQLLLEEAEKDLHLSTVLNAIRRLDPELKAKPGPKKSQAH